MKNPALPKYFFLTAKREDKLILLLYVDYLRSYFNVYVRILISQLLYWITVKLIEKPRFYPRKYDGKTLFTRTVTYFTKLNVSNYKR